jgi:uroporphyrinogen decarboxylase
MISPALYRELIQPSHIRLSALIKKKTEGAAKVFLHSDGSIFDMLPDIIDAGIEVLNPVQPQAAKMDAVNLKEKFGKRLVFHGGLDQQQIPMDRCGGGRRCNGFLPGRKTGYIFPRHNLQPDAPENIPAFIDRRPFAAT